VAWATAGLPKPGGALFRYNWSMIFSDLPSPAEAGFAQAGNRYPLFGITL
jgi:hypothetical protein